MRIRAWSSLDQRGASKRISSRPVVRVLHCTKVGYTAAVHPPVSAQYCFANGRRSYTCACSSGARACSLRQKPASIARVVDVMRNASPAVRSDRSRPRNGRSRCRNRRSRSRNGRSPSSEIRNLHVGVRHIEKILMRRAGDRQADDRLKRGWLLDGSIPRERVLCVYDDRQRVVDMWRDEGLACFQVAPGDF